MNDFSALSQGEARGEIGAEIRAEFPDTPAPSPAQSAAPSAAPSAAQSAAWRPEYWDGRVFIGLGANLPLWPHMPPRATLGAALAMLEQSGVRIARRSRWRETLPVPYDPAQPHYVNAVIEVQTRIPARPLMALLLNIETALGRVRAEPNAPRTIDLDLLAYGPAVHTPAFPGDLALPHPRMEMRAFVMAPLAEIAPDWRHPESGRPAQETAVRLNVGGGMTEMADGGGPFGAEWGAPEDLPRDFPG